MMTAPITRSLTEDLENLLAKAPADFTQADLSQLESLFQACVADAEHDSRRLIQSLIIQAFNLRLQSDTICNHIYLNKSETPQIELFRMLIEQFPFVKHSQNCVNDAILNAIGDDGRVTIVDIGIGQGVQMLHLLDKARYLKNLRSVHIIGIEPFADALEEAGRKIRAFNAETPFRIEFTGIRNFAEHVDFGRFTDPVHPVIVNASLALHHIQDETKRNETLAKIRRAYPRAFFLIEPNVNHNEADFFSRYRNCFNHYYNLFRVIDRLEIPNEDKNVLKLFFGREIRDVLGTDDSHRFERHEPATTWISRLEQTGFKTDCAALPNPPSGEYGVVIRPHTEGFLGFTYDTETILAVLCVRPNN